VKAIADDLNTLKIVNDSSKSSVIDASTGTVTVYLKAQTDKNSNRGTPTLTYTQPYTFDMDDNGYLRIIKHF
jgi:hypothetical protein